VLVGLSTSGRQALQAARKRLRASLRGLLAGLPPHDQGEFVRLLVKLADGLNLQALELFPLGSRSR
jgi:DNA-binding MarR family transcriptional regulator